MSYTKNKNGLIKLDTGDLISVAIERQRSTNGSGVVFTVTATWVDANGDPKEDTSGQITSVTTFNADNVILASVGEDAVAAALLKATLGEPQDTIPLSEDFLTNVNIRNHIQASKAPALDAISLL